MAISREKKEEIVQKVTDIVNKSGSVVFVNFHGLSVSDASAMRQELKGRGVNYTVAKKTLIRRVLEGAKIEGEMPSLDGELAIASAEDQILPAQSIVEFQKKLDDAVTPLGGIFEKRYISKEEVRSLALIPSREVLYSQLVTVINAPIQQTVGALNAITQSFVCALHQIAQSKS